jgi:hypothetical protein
MLPAAQHAGWEKRVSAEAALATCSLACRMIASMDKSSVAPSGEAHAIHTDHRHTAARCQSGDLRTCTSHQHECSKRHSLH